MNKHLHFVTKFCFLLLFVSFQTVLLAQHGSPHYYDNKAKPKTNANTSTLTTSYTMTACGLDWTHSSVRLQQRAFSFTPATGVPQPATMAVTGIPACKNILKAFLYIGVAGNGISFTTSLTNPANTNSLFPMAIVGSDGDLCWGFDSTFTYRADVTALISGNGTYTISGVPTATTSGSSENDADGATLVIIYSDPSQNYTGSIVIADGCQAMLGGTYVGSNLNGFNACASTTATTCFMLLADLQQLQNTEITFNNSANTAPNFTKTLTTDNVWDFVVGQGPGVTSGQNSSNFGMQNGGDCVGLLMTGMYYRTSCLTCTTSALTLSVATTPSCLASATITPMGGTGPFSYTWTGAASQQTTGTISSMPAGSYTVTVSDKACHTTNMILNLTTPAPTVNVTYTNNICKGAHTKLIVTLGGTGTTYTWSGPAITASTVNQPTAYVTPTSTAIYTVAYTNTLGCKNTKTVSVVVKNCTGIEEQDPDDGIIVYPNPGREKFTVSGKKAMTLEIINALGQIVKTVALKEENNYEFTVTGLSKGIYYLTTPLGEKAFKRKIIVE